jgi:hypothetical protein
MRPGADAAKFAKCAASTLLGKQCVLGMALALGFVQALSAGEHQVGDAQQCALALQQLPGCMAEGREFVHAVVHHADRRKARGQRHGHGRVEPQPVVAHADLLQVVGEQHLQLRNVVVVKARGRAHQMRPQHRHALARRELLQRRMRRAGHGFLDEHNVELLREAGKQLLRALVDEIPAQVGKDDECGSHGASWKVGR